MSKKKEKLTDIYEPLSDEELEMLRAAHEGETDRSTLPPHDNSDLAKAKRYVKKNKWNVLFVTATVILLLAVIAVLVFLLVDNLKSQPSSDDFTVTFLGTDETYTIPYDEAMIDGVFCLDVIEIAKYADLVVSGSKDSVKIICSDGSYVRFENGASTATVNGTRVKLGGSATVIRSEESAQSVCLVPFSFIEKLFSHPLESNTPGLRTVFSSKTNSLTIGRAKYSSSGAPLPIGFDAKCFENAEEFREMALKKQYTSLSLACVKKTMLVNKNNPLGEGYTPQGLFSLSELDCPTVDGGQYELVREAAYSLEKMLKDMESSLGRESRILVTSAYRSYSKQKGLYEGYVEDLMEMGMSRSEAEEEVSKTAAKAGYSEHQSGLCVDFIEKGKLELDEGFENCAEFDWLYDNAHKYGFVLRYPKDKVSITGYSYEPWHFRFVGIDASYVMYEDNICLEEYLAR